MKIPEIDETKLPEVMELIDRGAILMEEKDCDTDEEGKQELLGLENRLREITGNQEIGIRNVRRYWSAANLETVARTILLPLPEKSNLTDEEIREIILQISYAEADESSIDYLLKVLKVETGLSNITAYIYWPNEVGMELSASIEEIIDRIIADKKNPSKVLL